MACTEACSPLRRVVLQCTAPGTGLPPDKPRYVMGIGYPLDIVLCAAMGADMFDSVYPTRTARFGVALVRGGTLKLRNSCYAEDFRWGACSPWSRQGTGHHDDVPKAVLPGGRMPSMHGWDFP